MCLMRRSKSLPECWSDCEIGGLPFYVCRLHILHVGVHLGTFAITVRPLTGALAVWLKIGHKSRSRRLHMLDKWQKAVNKIMFINRLEQSAEHVVHLHLLVCIRNVRLNGSAPDRAVWQLGQTLTSMHWRPASSVIRWLNVNAASLGKRVFIALKNTRRVGSSSLLLIKNATGLPWPKSSTTITVTSGHTDRAVNAVEAYGTFFTKLQHETALCHSLQAEDEIGHWVQMSLLGITPWGLHKMTGL